MSTVNEGPSDAGGAAGSAGSASAGGAGNGNGGSAGSSVENGGAAQGGNAGNPNGGSTGNPNGGSAGNGGASGGGAGAGGTGNGGTGGALPNAEWYRQFGTSETDGARGIGRAPNGDILVLGNVPGALPGQIWYGLNDPFLRRYDANGNELWTRQFGTSENEVPTALAVDQLGDAYLAMRLNGAFIVQKYAADGSKGWTGELGNFTSTRVGDLAIDGSNNLFVVGETRATLGGHMYMGGTDAFIWKYSAAGDDQWIEQFGTDQGDGINAIDVDAAGNLYIAGGTTGKLPGETQDGTEPNTFVRRYNAAGGVMWTHQFGGTSQTYTTCVAHDGEGGLYVGGYISGALTGEVALGSMDAFVRKYDASGAVSWTLQFGTTSLDYLFDCALDHDGNLRAVGESMDLTASLVAPVIWTISPAGVLLDTRFLGSGMVRGQVEKIALVPGWVLVAGTTYDSLPGQSTSGGLDVFLGALKE